MNYLMDQNNFGGIYSHPIERYSHPITVMGALPLFVEKNKTYLLAGAGLLAAYFLFFKKGIKRKRNPLGAYKNKPKKHKSKRLPKRKIQLRTRLKSAEHALKVLRERVSWPELTIAEIEETKARIFLRKGQIKSLKEAIKKQKAKRK